MRADVSVKAVVFDAFGTLIRIGTRLRPYRQLQRAMERYGRSPQSDDAVRMMTTRGGIATIAAACRVHVPPDVLAPIEADLLAELETISLYEDTTEVLRQLRTAGFRLGLCSNLAAPYGVAAKLLVPGVDAYAMSYEVGALKPDVRIYRHVCSALGVDAGEVLFIGDTPAMDFDGPKAFGMQACLLQREGASAITPAVRSLTEVSNYLGMGRL